MLKAIHPLRLNVGFVAHESIGYSRVFSFNLPNIHLLPDLDLREFRGKIRISRATQGLLFDAHLQGFTDLECARCLETFNATLVTNFTELFTFPSHADSNTELVLPENGVVDLTQIVSEYFLLEIPINPICKEDCKGLCPVCGINLNKHSCKHETNPTDPRLAVLKSLIKDQ